MSLGLGIFLSTFLISILLLYRWTRDRWNWRKLLLRVSLAILSLILLSALTLFVYFKYENRVTKQNSYSDIALGMTVDEVFYIKGEPSSVLDSENKDGWYLIINTRDIKKGKTVRDFLGWQFAQEANESDSLNVLFADRTKRVSRISCSSKSNFNCTSVLGIYQRTYAE